MMALLNRQAVIREMIQENVRERVEKILKFKAPMVGGAFLVVYFMERFEGEFYFDESKHKADELRHILVNY